MTVLVKRLRARSQHLTAIDPLDLCEEAADEIERLRQVLERVLANSYFNNSADILTPLDILRTEVREALRED